jgi:hypothetical protein
MINIDKSWLLAISAIALGAAAGATVTSKVLRRRQLMAQHHDHAEDLKAWENEGGNLAPPVSTSAVPAHG